VDIEIVHGVLSKGSRMNREAVAATRRVADEDANPALERRIQADELPGFSLQMISTMCGA
jgi:hypothetical protein